MLKRRIFCERELSADAGAVTRGTNAKDLSLALLNICERKLTIAPAPASYAGLFSLQQKRLVERRVVALTKSPQATSRGGFFRTVGSWVMWLVVALTLSASSIGGYASIDASRVFQPNAVPEFLKSIFSSLGISG
jgi:hypothetical protein